ncbi:hypothetical protein [Flavobacterium foetidum]|uniref:hypothetical protein n=1 Tax=Flavobacterium foetidum TaxID=2026681 RepID=UPI001074EA6A|nr:hypothetical protein [Flavobacterium foetidum]KAF2518013.1 hypothetical protein E0W73_02015 [Flavobacterium foetidum]
MDIEFYKELHNRELTRRKEVEDGVNIPIGLITLLIGLISYFTKDESVFLKNYYVKALIILMIIFLLISSFYIARAYNGLFKGFEYENLPLSKKLLDYENEVEDYNKDAEESEKINFEDYLKNNFAEMAEHNKIINDERSVNLHLSKKYIFLSVTLSLVLILIYLTKTI